MQKVLPDTSFLAQWRDKIEALIITHGHEDHIGALPWVVPGEHAVQRLGPWLEEGASCSSHTHAPSRPRPALDPSTPIFAGGFPMQLVRQRLLDFNLWDESRARTMTMRQPFQAGPFQCEPFRVTHSIPDACGLILRCDHGTVVHTGDWKIDEEPVDGEHFDRGVFEQLGGWGW